MYSVLFLCTGNSARSILAESLLNRMGEGRFRAFSAGSQPKGQPHPMALEVLRSHGFPSEGLRSKSWHEFTAPGARPVDLVVTVCDNAAGESCPVWPGRPMTAHWGIADPAAVEGAENLGSQRHAFEQAMHYLHHRISLLISLPDDGLDELALRSIGKGPGASEATANG